MLDLASLLKYAGDMEASDVHIAVGLPPMLRVHGKLIPTNYPKMTASDTLEILLKIVSPIQREHFEQEGEIDLSVTIPSTGRYRVNAYKQKGCITLAFRLVDMSIPKPEELMIPETLLDLCQEKKGLIIVSGPSGSGKSTVLASLIDHINSTRETNIITIEDPIEYLHNHNKSIINQREVGLDTVSYSKGLMSALKEDPDIIQLGMLPDDKVAKHAFIAAQTGRLIFTSMYTQGVVETIESIISLFDPIEQVQARHQLSRCLKAVVTRQLCDGTEGNGRVAVYGIMRVNNQIRSLIKEGKLDELDQVIEASDSEDMFTMDKSLKYMLSNGTISPETAIKHASDTESMEEWVRRQSQLSTGWQG